MPSIIFNNVSFYYTTPYREIFKNLNLEIDTSWKCGLIGRNGKGKSTLFKLIHKELSPTAGFVKVPVKTFYFISLNANRDYDDKAKDAGLDFIGQYRQMERDMESMVEKSDIESIDRVGEIREEYERESGYTIRSSIIREAAKMNLGEDILEQPFSTLSGGEKTKLLIASMFAYDNGFMLLDEPTNHLDIDSREIVAEYLSKKRGFIVVSHDRYFLDMCTDHTISMNKENIEMIKGNYSAWRDQYENKIYSEMQMNENLTREIKSLKRAADERRLWADAKEDEVSSAGDRGFVSHMAAKLMKRALNIERRMDENIIRKEKLLKDFEKTRDLKVESKDDIETILTVRNLSFGYDEKKIIDNLTFTIKQNNRIALIGQNGSGKTTLIKLILGELNADEGDIKLLSRAKVAYSSQEPLWQSGKLEDKIKEAQIDRTKFSQITGSMGIERNIFSFDIKDLSDGEKKKVDLARTLLEPSNLIIWDEPLNYMDVPSREMLERMILKYKPTMLFVEHDRYFIENTATDVVEMNERN
ncbi:MAG: ribosomal protection-like ABC-F family protein [bacterium]